MKLILPLLPFLLLTGLASWAGNSSDNGKTENANSNADLIAFFQLFSPSLETREEGLVYIKNEWKPEFAVMAVETLFFVRDQTTSDSLRKILEEKTGKDFGYDTNAWYRWIWSKPEATLSKYPDFKGHLYKFIDPKFEKYFANRYNSQIRLDEVRWGGVVQDGIPPLRNPKMIPAAKASYLNDNDVVFGIELNGDLRAYPKRILAWHEMFVDTVGGVPVAGVYCTLCGTVILYKTEFEGVSHEIGTSGFLYRSNKVMYDKATQSLWNTFSGEPVLGPLVGKGIQLDTYSVVTTTWGEWKKRHPKTLVLSLDTGHRRDYGEGAAYRDYFATDELMFTVPVLDTRLKNKDEVLALRVNSPDEQLAISVDFLRKNPIYHDQIGEERFVVLTDKSGANRVYERGGNHFVTFDGEFALIDKQGHEWEMSEDRLVSEDGIILERLPYHRAFWFGWYAQFPDTRLVM
ncbi:DUF3179 domain-containing protein [Rubellicoccus peritrichatus]|uniref:DUF3179 domain-containing protein n=1 Tax=Rubellicoccus peritrichatus TaxID=3080537 RepID=A0AAQ3L5Y3_9BACT|nr:DUF3179 domain-containing protein [Puniceicoccus sp. CR14]WOO39501.1 DUF3179 domain-containing protein [Puniceicoccus sp. CR14]